MDASALDARKLWRHLDAVRDARHLSWRDVEKMTGVCRSTIRNLEGGITSPRAETLLRLRRFIGLSERAFEDTFRANLRNNIGEP
jgi:transcriptional regulator with XRE-family HTH domain